MVLEGRVVDYVDHRADDGRLVAGDPVEEGLQPALRALAVAVEVGQHRRLGYRRAEQARPDQALALRGAQDLHLRVVHHVVLQLALQVR